eukprot:scaffold70433_cov27-Tisochrysis_lutea.AAC.1
MAQQEPRGLRLARRVHRDEPTVVDRRRPAIQRAATDRVEPRHLANRGRGQLLEASSAVEAIGGTHGVVVVAVAAIAVELVARAVADTIADPRVVAEPVCPASIALAIACVETARRVVARLLADAVTIDIVAAPRGA